MTSEQGDCLHIKKPKFQSRASATRKDTHERPVASAKGHGTELNEKRAEPWHVVQSPLPYLSPLGFTSKKRLRFPIVEQLSFIRLAGA